VKNRLAIVGICFLVIGFSLTGCGSSLELPSKEESQKKISELKPVTDSLDAVISGSTQNLPKGYDIISRTRLSSINMLLNWIATIDVRDIHIDFLQTRPLWKEEKSLFGIAYSNYVDVDTGSLDIDLKKFRFTNFTHNTVNAEIEIEGTGSIRVSGKYAGVPASASPTVHFYMSEPIEFAIFAADSDYIQLVPLPKTVLLKTKVTISLLGWNVPYYKELPLHAEELIKPVIIPSALRSEIVFPVPASQYGERRVEFVRRFLSFTKTSVNAKENILEYRSNIDFEK